MTNQERAAEVLYNLNRSEALHDGFNDPVWEEASESTRNTFLTFAKALDDGGLLMPDLPDPSRRNHRGEPIWETEGATKVMAPGKLPVRLSGPFGEGWDMFPIEARDTACALLAAANYAKKERTNG